MPSSLATTLAFKATNASQVGIKILAFTHMPVLAGLKEQMAGALSILNLIGLVLAFGGLLFAAVMFMMGQTERMIYGLIGALIGGLSFLIVKAMFSSSDSNAADLSLGTTS
jgi:uncharacterized membrane protein YgdD (TMEM256/DUF423 family)